MIINSIKINFNNFILFYLFKKLVYHLVELLCGRDGGDGPHGWGELHLRLLPLLLLLAGALAAHAGAPLAALQPRATVLRLGLGAAAVPVAHAHIHRALLTKLQQAFMLK